MLQYQWEAKGPKLLWLGPLLSAEEGRVENCFRGAVGGTSAWWASRGHLQSCRGLRCGGASLRRCKSDARGCWPSIPSSAPSSLPPVPYFPARCRRACTRWGTEVEEMGSLYLEDISRLGGCLLLLGRRRRRGYMPRCATADVLDDLYHSLPSRTYFTELSIRRN